MKKHLKIALIIFIVMVALGLITNFVGWDETPLEEGLSGVFFLVGFLSQIGFERFVEWWVGFDKVGGTPYDFTPFGIIYPIVSGLFWSALYLAFARVIRRVKGCTSSKKEV